MIKLGDIFTYDEEDYANRAAFANENGYVIEEIEPDENGERRFQIQEVKIDPKDEIRWQIINLKKQLSDTDYKAIKYAEGILSEEEYAEDKAKRAGWRAEINRLEARLAALEELK